MYRKCSNFYLMDSSEELMSFRMRQQKYISLFFRFFFLHFVYSLFLCQLIELTPLNWNAFTLRTRPIEFDKGFLYLPTLRLVFVHCWCVSCWSYHWFIFYIHIFEIWNAIPTTKTNNGNWWLIYGFRFDSRILLNWFAQARTVGGRFGGQIDKTW